MYVIGALTGIVTACFIAFAALIVIITILFVVLTIRLPDVYGSLKTLYSFVGFRKEFFLDMATIVVCFLFTGIVYIVYATKPFEENSKCFALLIQQLAFAIRFLFVFYSNAIITNSAIIPALRTWCWKVNVNESKESAGNLDSLLHSPRFVQIFKVRLQSLSYRAFRNTARVNLQQKTYCFTSNAPSSSHLHQKPLHHPFAPILCILALFLS